ncbi:MAG: hypothetical protein HDT25_04395 [Ruminococcus sp.]|nr:hypothetical protein [Ruminococcus sp.]
MTAFDIYSAVGGVGEDILEESEIMPKKKITKMIPLMAAAACFAVFAAGLSQALRNDDIEQPVTDTSEATNYSESENMVTESGLPETGTDWSDTVTYVTYDVTESAPQTAGDGFTAPANTDQNPNVSIETIEMHTETQHTVTEEISDIPEEVEDEEVETVGVPKWEDLSDLEKYVYLEYNGNEYHITLKHFNGNELTFLQNGRLYGIDENHIEDIDGPVRRYSEPCVFYKINNISPDYMIAVLTADGKYRGFENTSYYAETLADHLAETDFLKYVDEGKFVAISDDTERKITNYTLDDLPAAVRKLLSAAPDAYPIAGMPYDPSYVPKCYSLRRSNGITFMHVYDDGSIYIYDRYYFIVGKENTDAFIKYVKENASDIEIIPYDIGSENDPVIPE